MDLVYRYSESTMKPDTISIGKTTAYLRKDIVSEDRTNEEGITQTFWTYQEAAVPVDEFKSYANLMAAINAVKGKDDSDNIARIVNNGSDSNNNQLILMEAIADLYDIIATMM